jgi:hypothetical protein
MSNRYNIPVTLLDKGTLVDELHYGLFSRYWWHQSSDDGEVLPIRIGQRITTNLKGHDFYVEIVRGNKENSHLPAYICEVGTMCSVKETNPTNAISNMYKLVCKDVTTKFSGPQIMGWNDKEIAHKLLMFDSFHPFYNSLDELKIFIHSIGSSSQHHLKNGGTGYQSSLIYKYKQKSSLFVSTIENDSCIIEIYYKYKLVDSFEDISPVEVWKKTGYIQKYDGYQLFGLDNSIVQDSIKNHKVPKCTPNEWGNFLLIKSLYDYHLKRRSLANIEWYTFFTDWLEKGSTIIEIFSQLEMIYPKNYEIKKRELGAWQAMLRASGCHNITPWTQYESKVC